MAPQLPHVRQRAGRCNKNERILVIAVQGHIAILRGLANIDTQVQEEPVAPDLKVLQIRRDSSTVALAGVIGAALRCELLR